VVNSNALASYHLQQNISNIDIPGVESGAVYLFTVGAQSDLYLVTFGTGTPITTLLQDNES